MAESRDDFPRGKLDLRILRALLLLAPLAAPPLFAASTSPDGGRLAFSFIGDPENIYLSKTDGSAAVALVEREMAEHRPEWYPDGRRILFTASIEGGPQLWRVDADGSNLTAVTPIEWHASDGHPSPDGTRVVYFEDAEKGFDLHILNLETGERRRLTDTPEMLEYAPRWSPDGKRIVFVRRIKQGARMNLWTLDLASGETRQVTRTPDGDDFHPAWSPDGRRLVFVRAIEGVFTLQVIDLESGRDSRVAHEPGVACFSPHFTPDGAWITFTRNVFEGTREGLPGVFRVRPDGSGLERLVGVPGEAARQTGQTRLSNEPAPKRAYSRPAPAKTTGLR